MNAYKGVLWAPLPHSRLRGIALKGIVFTEFFDFVERAGGEDLLDRVIVAADLANGGAYTRVGTYPFDEMLSLVSAYTEDSGRAVPEVLGGFGQHCFTSWVRMSPDFFGPGRSLFDILDQIDGFHEQEVRKLYPDAELPSFVTEQRTETTLVIGYHSSKQLTDLAIGVIKGAAAHVGQPISISSEAAMGAGGPYARLRIELTRDSSSSEKADRCPMSGRN
jgi:hypothetical protein